MNLNSSERETTVVATDDSDVVVVWSAIRRHITKMRRNPQFTEVKSGHHGTTEWAEFHVPADRWSPVGVKRQVSLTNQQRDEARARFQSAVRGEGS